MNISSMLILMKRFEGAYRTLCEPVFHEFEISQTSFDILLFLKNNPQFYTAKDFSEMRNIKANVVSLHVDRLVNDGYLLRQSVDGDRRKIRLVCTEKAQPIIEKGREVQRRFYENLMAGLTEEELDVFRHCFDVIAENAAQMQCGKEHKTIDGGHMK